MFWSSSESYMAGHSTGTPMPSGLRRSGLLEFFLNGAELSLNSVNSQNLINH